VKSFSKLRAVYLISFVALALIISPALAAALNPQPEPPAQIQVLIDGTPLSTDVAPIIEQGRTLVPLRAIFEALGATVEWNGESQTVTALKGNLSVILQIGNTTAEANGKQVELEVPPQILNGRTLVPVRFVSESLGASVGWDDASRSVLITTSAPAAVASPTRINDITRIVHTDFQDLVSTKKLPVATALQQQREFLLKQPEVSDVTLMKGNMFVKFTDGYELLMLMGQDNLGSDTSPLAIQLSPSTITKTPTITQPTEIVKEPSTNTITPVYDVLIPGNILPLLQMCAPKSNKAMIFDCLEDDANVISPKISVQAKNDLSIMGYIPTMKLNNNASLATAASIDDGEYGVVLLRGHGGVFGSDFAFLVRPWYTNPPPMNSGYTGTIVCSAYNHAAGATQYGYAITGQFASTYWTNKAFPGTMFFLESCHGADPGALPGMPTWTVNHGAGAWLGWNDSVSFYCGDNGTDLFFEKMKARKSVSEALAAVSATGCRPPDLTVHPSSKGSCKLAYYIFDPNESSVTNGRDFKLLRHVNNSLFLYATVSFYAAPSFDEFYFYVSTDGDAPAEVLIKCHPGNFEVYKETTQGTGLYNKKIHTGTPSISGNNYSISVPWDTVFAGATNLQIWLYDMTSKDRLPDPPILY
jgi:hypothetical protein